MAKILTFRPTEHDRDRRGDEMRADVPAQVIVFPGVRYERWDDAGDERAHATSDAKGRSRNQRRDVLDLG